MKTLFKNIAMRLFMLFAALVGGVHAQAQDVVKITTDTNYTTNKTAIYSFEAPKSGMLTIHFSGSGQMPAVYTDETCSIEHAHFDFGGFYSSRLSPGQTIIGSVEAGKVYYIKIVPLSDFIIINLELEDPDKKPEIDRLSPAEGSVFAVSGSGMISVSFSKNITFDGAMLMTTSGREVAVHGENQNGTYGFDIKDELFNWMQNGTVKPGDAFYFVMTGVCDATNSKVVYGDDGTLSVKYIVPQMPIRLVEDKLELPKTFLSYWSATSKDGVAVFHFDGNVGKGAVAELGWGDREVEGGYYVEDLPVVIEGKKITVDFRDKQRTPTTMGIPTGKYTTIRFTLANVLDTQGNPCYTDGQGVVGSFTYILDYKDVSSNITSEFLPLSGSSLKGEKSIELWISDASAISSYSGIRIEYTTAKGAHDVVIKKSDLDISTTNGELTITIPISEEIQNAWNITVSIADVVYVAGYDHGIEASYNAKTEPEPEPVVKPEIASVTPSAGSTLSVTDDCKITISFTKSITYKTAQLSCGVTTATLAGKAQNGAYVFDVKETLLEWLNTDKVKDGDNVTFTMSGVCDATDTSNCYGSDGTVKLDFKSPAKPTGIADVAVSALEGKLDIHAIDGRIIALDADKTALQSLPAGLYIVNGTKIYIK